MIAWFLAQRACISSVSVVSYRARMPRCRRARFVAKGSWRIITIWRCSERNCTVGIRVKGGQLSLETLGAGLARKGRVARAAHNESRLMLRKTDDVLGRRSLFAASRYRFPRIRSLAFSAIMIVGAFVLEPTRLGMIELSQIRMPSSPLIRHCVSTTDISSVPILQVQVGW